MFIAHMVQVFREVRRVLRADGTCWVNLGDSYASDAGKCRNPGGGENSIGKTRKDAGAHPLSRPNVSDLQKMALKPKDLVGIPWRFAFAAQDDGWWLRQEIIWSKPAPMPESVRDRCTKSHEQIFLLTKNARYYFDQEAILEPCSQATHDRLSQNVQDQIGSERAHAGGKSNGNMKAVGRLPDIYKGSLPGRNGGPGQDRRGDGDRGRKLAESGSGTKNNQSFDAAMAIMPDKRNKRSVWTVGTEPFSEAHFATFPTKLIEPCILAGCPPGGHSPRSLRRVVDDYAGCPKPQLQEHRHRAKFRLHRHRNSLSSTPIRTRLHKGDRMNLTALARQMLLQVAAHGQQPLCYLMNRVTIQAIIREQMALVDTKRSVLARAWHWLRFRNVVPTLETLHGIPVVEHAALADGGMLLQAASPSTPMESLAQQGVPTEGQQIANRESPFWKKEPVAPPTEGEAAPTLSDLSGGTGDRPTASDVLIKAMDGAEKLAGVVVIRIHADNSLTMCLNVDPYAAQGILQKASVFLMHGGY